MVATISIPKRTVQREILNNGTTLLYTPNPYNNIVAVRILSRIASRHEIGSKAGLVNMCFRLIAAGTSNSTEEQISDNLERHGSNFKSEAGKDYSSVNLLSTMENLSDDLSVVQELIDSPIYPEDKVNRDREIVKMMILEQEDSHLSLTVKKFREVYFGESPYAWSSIGKTDTIDSIQRDDLVALAEQAFDPSQLIVSVVGGSSVSEVFSNIRSAFEKREPRRIKMPLDTHSQPAIFETKQTIQHRETESEYILLGYPGEGLKDDAAPALRLISAILGGSMDSRLFREIRDKRGLCYQVGSSYNPNFDHSPLMAYIVTTPKNRMEAITCTEAEIEKLKEELVPEDELNRVKSYVAGSYVMSMETNMGQASRYATYEIAGLGWDYANKLPDDLNSVTAEEIRDTARKFFTHYLLTITAPPVEPGAKA